MVAAVNVSEFDFDLPDELVAQDPPAQRGASRLLVLNRATGAIEHTRFADLPRLLRDGDLLVLNDTRVFPARLLGNRVHTGGAVECLLVNKLEGRPEGGPLPAKGPEGGPLPANRPDGVAEEWEALMHPGQKLKPGARVLFEGSGVRIHGEVLAQRFFGRRTIRLQSEGLPLAEAINRIGHIPLPPYIRRDDRPDDHERYQTVYARERGSIAAPTAGLHFTTPLLDELRERGVEQVRVTLHVGYGTFKPVRVDRVEDHTVDPEQFAVSPDAAKALTQARRDGRRIIAVGTTTVRALESLTISSDDEVLPQEGAATLFIHPGFRFQVVQGLVTNFHLPKSSLLMLVAAFAGRERVLDAYRAAVAAGYRFYSYGDAMLIV